MSNTSTIHIKTDFDCKVYDYGQELGTTKADTYFNIELRKGDHELSFVYLEYESILKTIDYKVEDVDCDYRLIVEIAEELCKKAEECYNSDYSLAYSLFEKAAKKGNAWAQFNLGLCYQYNLLGRKNDYDKAVNWYIKAASQGHAMAQCNLGFCYCNGTGVEQDYTKAAEWFSKAAEQGNADAQCNLAICYAEGNGVEIDLSKAIKWYTKAANQSNMIAQFLLGKYYEKGVCVKKDFHKAVDLYTKSAVQGFAEAQCTLGICYENGIGVEKNIKTALNWYKKAADQGDSTAQKKFVECFEYGKLFTIDIDEALKQINQNNKRDSEQESKEDAEKNVNHHTLIETKQIHYLFFDTETAGLPKDYNAPTSNSNNWPRLVQLGWITTDENCNILSQNDFIIYPEDFSVPLMAASLHGITTEIAKEKGHPLKEVLEKFMEDFKAAKTIVGHNIVFDKKIVGAELIRLGQNDIMNSKQSLCTMEAGTDYCKIPGYHGYKWPKLQELHKKLFGCEFEDAHNSMSDVTATLKCFKEMKKQGWI